ncbi:integral membrane protein [Streptomyces bingchenggensis BCW-1]|uniref:Integral membrane protein n=1 Tax=Streptomyces bingchenggensis (strain BCW-1) TaxID=749414 RepID=D7CHU4_STRBB|nr:MULTISPECIES: Uma2 family endonuclease [Streptomyces]ADI09144.1 integral membrane protein [Streptomyces bingchenggensis BCW-1]
MTLAPEHPCPPVAHITEETTHTTEETTVSLIDIAETVFQNLPGYRPEILGGQLIVTPPADPPHAESLTNLTLAFAALHQGETRVVQAVGIWLPTGEEDYAIPDLAVVDADHRDHMAPYNCIDPAVFRMVFEVTSSNWRDDLDRKPSHYARAGVPVYVIGDRKHGEVIVLTDPHDGEYRTRSVHRPGESFVLPESIGAKVELEVDSLLSE